MMLNGWVWEQELQQAIVLHQMRLAIFESGCFLLKAHWFCYCHNKNQD
jgi:G:T-mismatch repair DNA endonuclease (very short patch repair protein)